MEYHYAEFNASTGKPTARKGVVEVRRQSKTSHRLLIHFKPGVTGYEAFNLDSFMSKIEMYRQRGIWICAGTKGRWNSAFVHALQIEEIYHQLNLDKLAN